MEKFYKGNLRGNLTLNKFSFNFITGLDSDSNINLSFLIINPNTINQTYNLVSKKQDKKTIEWDAKYQIYVNNGHSIMFQAFHSKGKKLIGTGIISLLALIRKSNSTQIQIYNQDTL